MSSSHPSRIQTVVKKSKEIRTNKKETIKQIITTQKQEIAKNIDNLPEETKPIIENIMQLKRTSEKTQEIQKNTIEKLIEMKTTLHQQRANSRGNKNHLINQEKYKSLKKHIEYNGKETIPLELETTHNTYQHEMKIIKDTQQVIETVLSKLQHTGPRGEKYITNQPRITYSNISNLTEALQSYAQLTKNAS